MEHLLGSVVRPCCSWHTLHKLLTSSGISTVLKNTWKSRFTKRRGKYTVTTCGTQGTWRIFHITTVACKGQTTSRQHSVPRCPCGRSRTWKGRPGEMQGGHRAWCP